MNTEKNLGMEKITIKISHVALNDLCSLLENVQLHQIWTREQKVVNSIMWEVLQQLLKKEISKRHTTKKFKMSFKYHEAFALEKSCRMLYEIYYNEFIYASHVALDVANQIDKQL